MNVETVKNANNLLKTIGRLIDINNSLDYCCRGITILNSKSVTLNVIQDSNKHKKLQCIEDSIIETMRDAGKKYVSKILKEKQKEFDKL